MKLYFPVYNEILFRVTPFINQVFQCLLSYVVPVGKGNFMSSEAVNKAVGKLGPFSIFSGGYIADGSGMKREGPFAAHKLHKTFVKPADGTDKYLTTLTRIDINPLPGKLISEVV